MSSTSSRFIPGVIRSKFSRVRRGFVGGKRIGRAAKSARTARETTSRARSQRGTGSPPRAWAGARLRPTPPVYPHRGRGARAGRGGREQKGEGADYLKSAPSPYIVVTS